MAKSKKQPCSKVVLAVICLFLGWWGIHRFVCGKVGTGIIFFLVLTLGTFTVGIPALLLFVTGEFNSAATLLIVYLGFVVWWIIDFFVILCGEFTTKFGIKIK